MELNPNCDADEKDSRRISTKAPLITKLLLSTTIEVDSSQLFNTSRRDKSPTESTGMAFEYTASLGHHPKPSCSDVHIRRRDPITKKVKTVPRLLHNLQANRTSVAKHELLEDDWRAFRSVYHNRLHMLKARFGNPSELMEQTVRENLIAYSMLDMEPDKERILCYAKKSQNNTRLETYRNSVTCPPTGYVYRRHLKERERRQQVNYECNQGYHLRGEPYPMSVVELDDPFKKMHVPSCVRRPSVTIKDTLAYDVDVIMNSFTDDDMHIYNEADAVPSRYVHQDFSLPLTERVYQSTHSVEDPALVGHLKQPDETLKENIPDGIPRLMKPVPTLV